MSNTLTTRVIRKNDEFVAMAEGVESIRVVGKTVMAGHKGAWSPVHMLVSAAETCFWVTFSMITEKARVEIKSVESEAEGVMESKDGKHFAITAIKIRPNVQLVNESDRPRLPGLYKKAEEYCVVGNSFNFKVEIVC